MEDQLFSAIIKGDIKLLEKELSLSILSFTFSIDLEKKQQNIGIDYFRERICLALYIAIQHGKTEIIKSIFELFTKEETFIIIGSRNLIERAISLAYAFQSEESIKHSMIKFLLENGGNLPRSKKGDKTFHTPLQVEIIDTNKAISEILFETDALTVYKNINKDIIDDLTNKSIKKMEEIESESQSQSQ
jgi:hypothetical protein